jgi:peptidoglycan/xylan/chitin deacetylase (PgdA/CDA1 family)
MVQWQVAQPIRALTGGPVLSVTFDDFPKSAAVLGARVVEAAGGRATFYACSDYAGQTTNTGVQYDIADLMRLHFTGHEIGGHSSTHRDLGRLSPEEASKDIADNVDRLTRMGVPGTIRHIAYPYGETSVGLKRAIRGSYATARGVLQGINGRGTDSLQLRAVTLMAQDWTLRRAEAQIDAAIDTGGWIILFTHDVSETPSPYGVTPQALDALIRRAQRGGARLLPVGQVGIEG